MRTVFCKKYQREMEGLDRPPTSSEAGQDIFENVSKQAYREWLNIQTILINEERLNTLDPDNIKFLNEQRELFFNNEEMFLPSQYVPLPK